MAEELVIPETATKQERYDALLPQIESLVAGEPDVVANLSNIAAALKQAMNFFWVGFYIVKNNELVLGPFQGPIACTRIAFGKGVCGASWKEKKVMLVPDVDQFPGHIACSSASKSEIVLPAFKHGEVALVLDVDSDKLNDFDATDEAALQKLMRTVEKFL
ncbi:MAG TPA: GAF domain-containing protein [Cyclobacteriaceae bacterium]|nr:GAF domain-containing protein [Cyclobacteriaceae bacterium]HMV08010.1 GAF domain-containing protein [Cyclobacteriaceae bacterium]HMV91639.1 GAF domain-containing protein [Cyclobacteriaceae bacterium]HMX00650.1 GAF domain-containing protein [Cyclobacteriaceae bacterium]HMX49475.1 GAF domain-containing protein [Cyclobacteriaceae bacterium]